MLAHSHMVIARHPRLVALLVALTAWPFLLPRPAEAQQLSATIEKEILVLDMSTDATGPIRSNDLNLVFDGREQPVTSVRPIAGSTSDPGDLWRFVIYVDPALASPEGLEQSISILRATAADLTRLGSVEIVVADPFAEAFMDPARDSGLLVEGLLDLEDYIDAAGEILALRSEMIAAQSDGDDAAIESMLAEEGSLQSNQRSEFLAWLAAAHDSTRPSLLILLQDGYDLNPFGSLPSTPEGDLGDRAYMALSQEQQTLAAVLASQGWIACSLAPPRPADGLLKSREDALWMLVEPTGGTLATGLEEWQATVAGLNSAFRLRARFSGPVDGIPKPVILRTRNGGRLRTTQWISLGTPLPISEIRAERELEDPGLDPGDLEIRAILRPDTESEARSGSLPAILEAMVPTAAFRGASATFRVTLLLVRLDEPPVVGHQLVDPGELSGSAWLYRKRLEIPDEIEGAVVVIEDLESGKWGTTTVEPSEVGFSTSGRGVVEWNDPSVDRVAPARSRTTPQTPTPTTSLIRVLPPKRLPARGRLKLGTLVSSPIVRSVDFYLDGEKVDSDDRPPFAGDIDLGDEVATHLVKVIAYAAGGASVGEHEITLNPGRDTFQVRISQIVDEPAQGTVRVEAELGLAPGQQLDRIEFYRNDSRVEVLQEPPFAIRLPRPDEAATDFVRVVAYLTDGTWIDDAQLLASTGISERVEVNLVELHVMVADRQGNPVTDLGIEDFDVRFRGDSQEIERLALAEEVPLILGLVIDTSESMWALMPDTKKAGAQFLTASLDEGDSAFLVDFDTQPRLAHGVTTEVVDLLRTFNGLTADGYTALFDATIFSMLQFEETRGRKALVLLTDGDDYKSRYGPRRCVEYGKRLGVPVYVISLAAIQNPRRNARRPELEGLAEATGGQVFYINEMAELSGAYAHINRELRSQYVLTFSTDRPLAEEELDAVAVEVDRRGLEVRAVVGGQQVQ